jgi:hypothetical protein
MIDHSYSEILDMLDIHNTVDKPTGMTMEAYRDHAITGSCKASGNIDFCSASKLLGARYRLRSQRSKWMFSFDVGNDTPDSAIS